MNLNEVINILEDKKNSKELYFCEKNKDIYESVCPEVSEEIFDILIQNAIDSICRKSEDEWIQYNPTGFREGTLEVCSIDYVGNYEEVINSFSSENIEIEKEKIDKFSQTVDKVKKINQKYFLSKKSVIK